MAWKFLLMTSPAEIVGMEPGYSSARTPCQAGNPVKFLFRVNQMGEALNSFILAISSLIKVSDGAFLGMNSC